MGNKIKRFMLCLLAVSMIAVSGNTLADNEETGDTAAAGTAGEETAAEGEEAAKSKAKETEEKVRAEYADIVEYLTKLGSADGIDVYAKPKDIDDLIWAANGGKPEKKSDYTEEQEALADKIDAIKKLGDYVAVDPETETALASFDGGSKCDEGKIFISDAGRYILYTDADETKPIRIMRLISSIDNPYVFSSMDGKKLEYMDDTLKKVRTVYTEGKAEDSSDEGKLVYRDETGNSFIWLSSDGTQVIGTYRKCAENDGYIMLVDDRLGNIGIKNKSTNYIWWSSPLGASRDKIATPLLSNELRSSSVLRYGVPEKRSNNNMLRSGTEDCKITVSDMNGGVKITYEYAKAGFKYPVEYTLESDHLKASLKVSEISETGAGNIATEVTLMGSFGAASDQEDGYFVIPDGSGALVRFNNNKTTVTNAYAQNVYGNDVTAVPTSKGAVSEQIYLPVYGIVKDDNALMVVASKGDSNAYLSTRVSGQSNSSYNLCAFTFVLRGTDTFYMSGNSNDKLTVFESGNIKSDDIELRYYPISKEDADYVDVAECYRDYLMKEEGLTAKTTQGEAPMYVDLYGGTQKKKPILGIPVTMKQPITRYNEAVEILTELKNYGAEDIVVSYNNWTNDGINSKVDTDAKPSGKLGGKSEFEKLTGFIDENGFQLYPVSDNRDFYSGNGYGSFSDTCVRISGSYSRIISYDRAYGIPDGFKKNMSLLSPSYFGEVYGEIAENYADRGLNGVSVGNITTSLYGDYGKKNISRYSAMTMAENSFGKLNTGLSNGILADCANAYALPYVNHITNVPLSSSRFDIFNEDIPFYQLVMHGIVPYSTTAVNADADSETLLLMAAATGSYLSYDMIYEETSTLKDTEYDVLYYANYENWAETAAAEYNLLKPIYEDTADSTITGYTVENGGDLITTEYSNGTVVQVDLAAKTIEFNGRLIELDSAEEGGIKF
ncbi:MAG: hypothetical protein J6K77_04690 [Ruminococcus sp.]|nr:hypothetical protein [Ruminococcus sp.]